MPRIEPRVLGDVMDDQHLPGGRHVAGQALADLEARPQAGLVAPLPHDDEVVTLDEPKPAGVEAELVSGRLRDRVEQDAARRQRHDIFDGFEQSSELSAVVLARRYAIHVLIHPWALYTGG
jgi:hypothetical protein